MKLARFARKGGGGVYYFFDTDVSDITFIISRKSLLRERFGKFCQKSAILVDGAIRFAPAMPYLASSRLGGFALNIQAAGPETH
jgi:hypothetical protein